MLARVELLGRLASFSLGAALAPIAAVAQAPSYTRPTSPNSDDVINGHIASIDGKYTITVRDDRGFIDDVHLHQGTIINPIGLTLAQGMQVTIFGYNAGSWFEANEIDTPYHYVSRPLRVYYGPGWWYPGFPYGYGPSFSLVVNGGAVMRRPFHPVPVHGRVPRIPMAVGHPYIGRR
ncbi:MAG TPA: hypothetical protein VGG22_16860 [Candidatus Baltobacteraceae bacterium]